MIILRRLFLFRISLKKILNIVDNIEITMKCLLESFTFS